MTTIIDSLVVELGLDPENFSKGANESIDKLKKLEEANTKKSKNTQESAKREGEALSGLKTQAIELFAVFTGVTGIKDFIAGTIQAGAGVGRLSRAIGVSANTISKWQGVAREFGSSGEAMASAFQSMTNVITAWTVGGPEAPGVMQILRVIETNAKLLDNVHAKTFDTSRGVDQTFKDLADNLKIIRDLSQNPALASYLAGKIPGMDAGLFDMLATGSDKVAESLKKVAGWTDAEAEAAGRVQRRWDGAKVAVENYGKTKLFQTADAVSPLAHELFDKPFLDSKPWDAIFGLGEYANAADRPTFTKPSTNSEQNSTSGRSTAYRNAIANIESRGSGGYAAVGPSTASGDRAYGRYQIMGNNIGEWSQAALGKKVSIAEFMASPEIQDKIFDHRFGQYVKQYGNPQDAASAWFTGGPLSTGANKRDVLGTSGASYAARFTAGMSGSGGGSGTTSMEFSGPITVVANSPVDFANKLREQGLKRAAQNAQAPVGGE